MPLVFRGLLAVYVPSATEVKLGQRANAVCLTAVRAQLLVQVCAGSEFAVCAKGMLATGAIT